MIDNNKYDLVDAYTNKGEVLRNLKKYEEAINCFDKAIEVCPDNAYAFYY